MRELCTISRIYYQVLRHFPTQDFADLVSYSMLVLISTYSDIKSSKGSISGENNAEWFLTLHGPSTTNDQV